MVLILGVKLTLEDYGFSVYVDWITDPKLNRASVTPETAQALRDRMGQCKNLVYVSTRSATTSKWMPWELGYFDGHMPGHVAVLPIDGVGTGAWDGQEYIGLYPRLNWSTSILAMILGSTRRWIEPSTSRRLPRLVIL